MKISKAAVIALSLSPAAVLAGSSKGGKIPKGTKSNKGKASKTKGAKLEELARSSFDARVGNSYSMPTFSPTLEPTTSPTEEPTLIPTLTPTEAEEPTVSPTESPTESPTFSPTESPTLMEPTFTPTLFGVRQSVDDRLADLGDQMAAVQKSLSNLSDSVSSLDDITPADALDLFAKIHTLIKEGEAKFEEKLDEMELTLSNELEA